jgi:hypothetical protein
LAINLLLAFWETLGCTMPLRKIRWLNSYFHLTGLAGERTLLI